MSLASRKYFSAIILLTISWLGGVVENYSGLEFSTSVPRLDKFPRPT